MAKDPAFLFYPGDYISGTMHLDFECKGAYMDLLMLQFQKDFLTEHMIKHMLGHKYTHIWSLIFDKFQEKDGKFWNERLRIEKEKRIKFCKSRRDNVNSTKHMDEHMSLHMENENIDILSIKNNTVQEENKSQIIVEKQIKKGFNTRPTAADFNGLPEINIQAAREQVFNNHAVMVTAEQIKARWEVFKVAELTGEKHHPSEAEVYRFFNNWLKYQKFKKETTDGSAKKHGGRQAGTAAAIERFKNKRGLSGSNESTGG